jgi:orotate phosphoribosyltransferase
MIQTSNNLFVSTVYNTLRQAYNGNYDRKGDWQYVSLTEHAGMVSDWIRELPKDFDIVCAIPRSGLITGSMIATTLKKPLTTPDNLVQGVVWGNHGTMVGRTDYGAETTILLVDDSVGSGENMGKAAKLIQAKFPTIKIIWAALVIVNDNKDKVDRYHIQYNDNVRISFEYNITRITTRYGKLACDMDGIICRDYLIPLSEEGYVHWIKSVDPYLTPTHTFEAIITNRKEKYRNITEAWLEEHRVTYKHLIMNETGGNTLQFKIDALLKIKPDWYWESDPCLAEEIYKATGIPTLCIPTGVFYGGNR